MIRVIEQTTEERKQETRELFNKIRPLLDNGIMYNKAVKQVKNLPPDYSCTQLAWFRDLIAYGETQGYAYKDYKSSAGRRPKQ